jgi:CheY-like chemotaxis protein
MAVAVWRLTLWGFRRYLPLLHSRGSVDVIDSKHLLSRARQQAVVYPQNRSAPVEVWRKTGIGLTGYDEPMANSCGATILLLDSEPLTRTILHETLERAGYLVVSVGDLGAAVDRLRRMRPDLLIVRPYINSMPGHMAAQHLRVSSPGLPVLVIDGYIDDERIHVRNAVHKIETFPRPFVRADLLEKVKDLCAVHK